MDWISVKDRLPDKNMSVLAVGGKLYRAKVICFNNVEPSNPFSSSEIPRGFWDDGYYMNDQITHWMPLPEPPARPEGDV